MRQHRKWLDTERRGPKVGPQCAEPRSLEGRHLLAVKVNGMIKFELCVLDRYDILSYRLRELAHMVMQHGINVSLMSVYSFA